MKGADRAILRLTFAALALWLLFVAWAQHDLVGSAGGAGAERPILILHGAANEMEARFVAQLAGRFGRPRLVQLERYRGGDVGRHVAAFVMPGAGGASLPAALLEDVRGSGSPLVWIGHGLDPELARRRGVAALPYRAVQFSGIDYRGTVVPGSGAPAPLFAVDPEGPARVLASGRTSEAFDAPWAVRSGSFAAFAEPPWSAGDASDRRLVFADLLFDVLGGGASSSRRRALIRIEGIGAETSPRRLRALTDLLEAAGVPFELALGGRIEALRDRPPLAEALRYATARGGLLSLRGPTAAPRDGMPPAPYETVDGDGALVIPSNLASAGQAAPHLAVRDSMLSYSHRWDADPERLRGVVGELRRLGYRFVGPREVVRAAPAHAELPLPRAAPIAVAAAGWLSALPWIDLPVLVALLALVMAMWSGAEMLLAGLDKRQPRPRHAFRKLKPGLRNAQVALAGPIPAAPAG